MAIRKGEMRVEQLSESGEWVCLHRGHVNSHMVGFMDGIVGRYTRPTRLIVSGSDCDCTIEYGPDSEPGDLALRLSR